MDKHFFICATDLTVIVGANPYRDIDEIYLKYWKKHYYDDYTKIKSELEKSSIPIKMEETNYECVKRLAKENNLDIKKELGSCMSTQNVDDLNKNKQQLIEKIKDKLPTTVKKEFNSSFNSLTNTHFGIKYESKGVELYQHKTDNSVSFDRKYHKKHIFEVPIDCIDIDKSDKSDKFIETTDYWLLGGKLDGVALDKNNTKYILEIKNRINRLFYSLKEYEKVQCYVYMYLMDIWDTHLVETLKSKDDNSINIIEIEFDEDYWDTIIDKTIKFIEDFYEFIENKKRKINLLAK